MRKAIPIALISAGLLASAAAIAYNTAPKNTLGAGPADVLVIFGSPVDYTGEPLPMQIWRVDEAVAEYRRGVAPWLLFTGGPAANRFVEAETMARETVRRGVPPSAILMESRAITTIENIQNITPVLQAHGWKRVEIISSADHLPRIALLLTQTHAPFQWRLHAAPTPGRGIVTRALAYFEESCVILVLRTFGTAAEPVIHGTARLVHGCTFAVRYVFYETKNLLRKR